MLKVYDTLQIEIDRIEDRMKFYLRGHERKLRIMMSVPGIGFVISSNLLAEIGDINDFPSSDKLANGQKSPYQSISLQTPITPVP
jgi:transposase